MKELDHTDLPPLEIVEAEVVEPGEGTGRPGKPAPDAAALGLELPEDRDQALALLLREVDQARNEATSYLDDLRRVAADFDNFRKRALREQQTTVDRAAERVVRACLPVLDSLDAALAIEAQTETERNLLGGMLGTRTLLLDILGKEGLEVVPTWGEPFDPEMHEAVVAPAGGEGSLVVAQELRRGYRLKGKVLRAALVSLEYE
jgi:molecular chaperone GrpE